MAQGRWHRAEGTGRRQRQKAYAEGRGRRHMQKAWAALHESKLFTFDSAWLVRAEAARP